MSSNIRIERICQHCNEVFIAKTTVTKYCGDNCAKRAYKARMKIDKIEKSQTITSRLLNKPIEEVKVKEFLSVRDVSILIGISIRTVYRLIENGQIKATKLGKRTIISRENVDRLFI